MSRKVKLRDVAPSDLPIFFAQQLDPTANQMAAFTAQDPANREAFNARWAKIMADEAITIKTILFDEAVAGHILSHNWFGEPEVSYWLGREYWGRGIATQALSLFLAQLATRPLYARAAKDNVASLRVLEKCGFTICGEDKGFANARNSVVEELILEYR
jgi:RimJ/RimL family protein N-acetyltransferase